MIRALDGQEADRLITVFPALLRELTWEEELEAADCIIRAALSVVETGRRENMGEAFLVLVDVSARVDASSGPTSPYLVSILYHAIKLYTSLDKASKLAEGETCVGMANRLVKIARDATGRRTRCPRRSTSRSSRTPRRNSTGVTSASWLSRNKGR